MEIFLADEAATQDFAVRLAPLLKHLSLVTLSGDLGSGKTTLVRGILIAMGYEGRVKSPTYSLVEPYTVNGQRIYHLDLYRLADPEELEYIGVTDYLDGEALALIEWPEKAAGWLPEPDIKINLKVQGQGRSCVLNAGSDAGKLALIALQNDK
ncbi:MAG TPA: tRNA (adenosine(37)-N6)-threonylcarbamoyltransferase complex ATPase subunit type 1 TsaE [Chromatiales bacterium]|nr:tRNA (adenosine(37)-N6)-threonylcarbamoyltransferase complex ATPase subunit type 1 TsaE [Thiotrichales bacterium]HIP67086.1 tRNA (adenosine(37)-N6)-threonylcarbamoyltransferase complex ATPase subunit type 1 TsaE [Chromatiales bacterium]